MLWLKVSVLRMVMMKMMKTDVSEDQTVSLPSEDEMKCWQLCTRLNGVTFQNTTM
jgi:hypothetical protein